MPFLGGMATLNNAELTQQVTEAVTKYLDAPKSFGGGGGGGGGGGPRPTRELRFRSR